MRFLIRLLFLGMAILLVLPFLISSLLVDQHGVIVPGHVVSKTESIWVRYSSWTRKLEITVQYEPPDDSGVRYLTADLLPDNYDRLKKGDVVELRYLLARDLPAWPGFRTMRQMRILFSARLADEDTWTAPATMISQNRLPITVVLGAAALLLAWGLLRIPYLKVAFGALILIGLVISTVESFPMPTPAPRTGIRTAAGTVKTLDRWQFLFQNAHSVNGWTGWTAEQPVAVVGVEFVPQEHTDPVVAVDLIDDGSIPGLSEHSAVTVDYETSSTRTAHIRGATRHFPQRNLKGLFVQLVSLLIVLVVILAGVLIFRLAMRLLTQRSWR